MFMATDVSENYFRDQKLFSCENSSYRRQPRGRNRELVVTTNAPLEVAHLIFKKEWYLEGCGVSEL